jgi:hypothetical protein
MDPAAGDKKREVDLEGEMSEMILGERRRFKFCFDAHSRPDSLSKVVRSVRFPISSNEAHTHTLAFEPAVSQLEALEAVRAFLDQPLERAYFDAVADDLPAGMTWDTLAAAGDPLRSCLLSGLDCFERFAPREGLEGGFDLRLGLFTHEQREELGRLEGCLVC